MSSKEMPSQDGGLLAFFDIAQGLKRQALGDKSATIPANDVQALLPVSDSWQTDNSHLCLSASG